MEIKKIKRIKKYIDIGIYDFSDYAEEITGNALFEINGGADPFEHNSIFDTRNGGNRADLSGIASDDTPKNFFDFCNSYFTRDKYE